MTPARETQADVVCAISDFAFVEGAYSLVLGAAAASHPDALRFAIVLAHYGIRELVETHYAVLVATGAHDVTGRVLYVNGSMPPPVPLGRAQRIVLAPSERADAQRRVAARRAEAALHEEAEALRRRDIERSFHRLAEQASRDKAPFLAEARSAAGQRAPYRGGKPLHEYNSSELQAFVNHAFSGAAIAAPFSAGVLEVVPDPFPPQRKRILVVDDDATTEAALAALAHCDIVYAHDGWSAIDHISARAFDLVLCAVVLGEFSGAKIYRMAINARPEIATRFAFLASKSAVEGAPPSSATGRVLARPVDPSAVKRLL